MDDGSNIATEERERAAADDAALVRAFQRGDERAFDEIYRRHAGRVFTICRRYLGDPHDAEECAQEVFLKLLSALRTFGFRSAFSTWLYRIAVNTCRDWNGLFRRRLRRMTRSLDEPPRGEDAPPEEPADDRDSPREHFRRKEIEEIVQRAISELPGIHREVVILRDILGLPYEEVAETVRTNVGTVKSRLSRARGELEKRLRGAFPWNAHE